MWGFLMLSLSCLVQEDNFNPIIFIASQEYFGFYTDSHPFKGVTDAFVVKQT